MCNHGLQSELACEVTTVVYVRMNMGFRVRVKISRLLVSCQRGLPSGLQYATCSNVDKLQVSCVQYLIFYASCFLFRVWQWSSHQEDVHFMW